MTLDDVLRGAMDGRPMDATMEREWRERGAQAAEIAASAALGASIEVTDHAVERSRSSGAAVRRRGREAAAQAAREVSI